jgi:DNA-binding CsgD family transcriptional regulator
VVAPVTVSEKDLRTLLGMFSEDRTDLPEAGLPLSLLSDLMVQIRCDMLTFSGQDTRRQEFLFAQEIGPDAADQGEETEQLFWRAYQDCDHCAYPDRGDLRSVTKTSDFYSARQWHSTRMCVEALRGIEHMLMLCLPGPGTGAKPGPGHDVRLVLFRSSGPDFSERDRALLGLLRPHVHRAYLDAELRRYDTPILTPRHRELLALVAAGYTNGQIARRLGISAATVRTHLQNIYERLGVSSRTAAVAKMGPDLAWRQAPEWPARHLPGGHELLEQGVRHAG